MISLYRGELHKVSGVPRQWTVPKSTIPVSVFKKALKKRNAALLKELQSSSSPERLLPNSSTPVASDRAALLHVNTDELEKRGVVPFDVSDGIHKLDFGAEESKTVTWVTKSAESSERVQEENENDIWHERKRKKKEDTREESDRPTPMDDAAQRDAEDQERTPVTRTKDSVQRVEAMAIDAVDQSQDMDCDIMAVEKTGMDYDEDVAEQDRVRVSETGTSIELEVEPGMRVGLGDSNEDKSEIPPDLVKDGEQTGPEPRGNTPPAVVDSTSAANVNRSPEDISKDTDVKDFVEEKVTKENARKRKREELQARLEKLTADKHHLVLMLKQVLSEEESKKRVSTNASQQLGQGAIGTGDTPVVAGHGEKLGGLQLSGDLEEGELEYARTPSPPPRPVQSSHSNHNVLGPPPPMVPILGRQNTLTQHISQGSSGRGGYYVPGTGIPPSPVGPGIGGGGALSPGTVYMGNLPSPLGPHNYSHNLALQHAAIHAQKIVPVPPGHGQFNSIPPNGAPLGAGPGVAGGPPGFGGYVVPPPLHPHHPHLSQTAASSTSHVPVQQGVVSSSLLTTPRGPVAYHDLRLGGNTWIPR